MARLRLQIRKETGICSPKIRGSGPLKITTPGYSGGLGLMAPGRDDSQSRKAKSPMNRSAIILYNVSFNALFA